MASHSEAARIEEYAGRSPRRCSIACEAPSGVLGTARPFDIDGFGAKLQTP